MDPEQHVKSIGHEETFPSDLTERATLEREVLRLADRVAARLRHAGCVARTVQLKVRYGDFRTITRSRTLAEPTDLASELARTAGGLLAAVDIAGGVRLLGVAAHQLDDAHAVQTALPLDADEDEEDPARRQLRSAVERSIDEVRDRYGDDAVKPARLVPGPERER